MVARRLKTTSKIRTYSSILTAFSLSISAFGTYPAFAATNQSTTFVDVGSNFSWALPAIQALTSENIISGRDPQHFAPQDDISRAEFAKLLVLSLKLPLIKPTTPTFQDVPKSFWGYSYIETAYSNGLIYGVGNQSFAPNESIKREDVVTMITRSLFKDSKDSLLIPKLSAFTDQQSIDSYAQSGVATATQLKIINGYNDHTFRPLGLTNRAEAAQIIYNMMNVKPDQIQQLEIPKLSISSGSPTVSINDTATYTAAITYPDQSTGNLPVTWSVTGDVGTIDANGVFTATKIGNGSIVATVTLLNGKQIQATTPVQVAPPKLEVSKISISSNMKSVTINNTVSYSAAVTYSDNSTANLPIAWSVTGDVGTIDANGVFTATKVGDGNVVATVTLPDGTQKQATTPVQVIPVITKLVASPASLQTKVGETQKIYIQAFDSSGNLVDSVIPDWSVTGDVGTIADDGTFTANKSGQGTITATITQPDNKTVSVSIPVTVVQYHVALIPNQTTTFYPGQNIPIKYQLLDDSNQPVTDDSSNQLTLTVTMPDGGTYTRTATDSNGVFTFTLSHTLAGQYSATASGDLINASNSTDTSNTVNFTIVPGAPAALSVFATPSPWVTPSQSISIKAVAVDQWGNQIPDLHLPIQSSLSDQQHGTLSSVNGSTGNDMTVGTFTAVQNKGDVKLSVSANDQGQTLQGSTTLHVYTGQGTGLVSGKGVWMMWSDWKNHNVDDTLAKLKAAGVTHIYLEVATTSDGFYGKDALDDFLPKAHDQGFVVIGWVYTQLKDPWADASQTIQVAQYTTPRGDKLDGIAADLEDNTYLSATNLDTFSKSLRSNLGQNYPLIAVTYPESWRPNYPWTTFAEYYDAIAPMDYWHYKEQTYTYDDVYNMIQPEVAAIRKASQNPYIAVTMIGQSYNMFNDANQGPTGTEITAAMQAAKDSGCIGYSTYRMYTATPDEWNAFANFKW